MKVEKTPEEAARSKRAHADSMIVMGAVTTVAALVAAWIAMSGRGDVPDWMFGGAPVARAAVGDWTNFSSAVKFSDWGPEPFARAKREGKLVLLFLGPSFSAPTTRMEAETFGDKPSAALAEARFVPVRVKSEEFPDLDRRYRAGGWPTTAALLPDGVVLDAGTAMTPAVFQRWAGALADKAATHPELLTRAEAEAADSRGRAAPVASAPAMTPADAERRAELALTAQWDSSRRTFDRSGPRFPRFERVAALSGLKDAWARALAGEAAKGALIFVDPKDGGFRRAANPDGSPAAREKLAADQAAALDVYCGRSPAAARRELAFLDASFSTKSPSPAWHGWQAGYVLSPDRHKASDGPDFEEWRESGWWLWGAARLGEGAELSRAVLDCADASTTQKAFARRVVDREWNDFGRAAVKNDPRLLLDDAVGLGSALLAAGRVKDAASIRAWMDQFLAAGPAYFDRGATGVLPAEVDRISDPALNAQALVFLRRLAKELPAGSARNDAARRADGLYSWLSARSGALDPAVWAALAAKD
jgi:hypothetical protein